MMYGSFFNLYLSMGVQMENSEILVINCVHKFISMYHIFGRSEIAN